MTSTQPNQGAAMRLCVDWARFGECIRAQAVIDATHISTVRQQLGLSQARMIAAAQGKPVGTEIFLTLCHWLKQDPMWFTQPAQRPHND